MFGAYVGWLALTNRGAQGTKFTINLMVGMIYLIFGVMALLFGQRMTRDQQWIFVALTFSLNLYDAGIFADFAGGLVGD